MKRTFGVNRSFWNGLLMSLFYAWFWHNLRNAIDKVTSFLLPIKMSWENGTRFWNGSMQIIYQKGWLMSVWMHFLILKRSLFWPSANLTFFFTWRWANFDRNVALSLPTHEYYTTHHVVRYKGTKKIYGKLEAIFKTAINQWYLVKDPVINMFDTSHVEVSEIAH